VGVFFTDTIGTIGRFDSEIGMAGRSEGLKSASGIERVDSKRQDGLS